MDDHNGIINTDKRLSIAHLNIRSLLGGHKFDAVSHQIENSGISIFTLSETWLTSAIPDKLIELPSYTIARVDRSWTSLGSDSFPKRGGGLMCCVSKDIKSSSTQYAPLNVSCKDLEMQWISINLEPIIVVNVYRPPQGDLKTCCKLLTEAFERTQFRWNTEFFVTGDFNVNFGDTKSKDFKELDFTMKSLGLNQLVHEPTRIAHRQGVTSRSTLDIIFTNSDVTSEAKTLDINLSDHLAVWALRKKVYIKREKVEFKGRSYKNYVKEDFQQYLDEYNWEFFYTLRDPDDLWHFIYVTILNYMDRTCPIKSFRVPSATEPWITNEAIEAIKDKDRLLRKAKKSGRQLDWDIAKRARNMVGRELELLRANFLKDQQHLHKADPKKFWNTISSVIPNKSNNSHGKIWLKDDNSGDDLNPSQIANFMNDFFTNIGPDLARNHTSTWSYFGERVENSIEDILTDVDEVIDLCKNIEVFKSSGFDDISSRICKDAFMVIPNQMAYLFNVSLETGIFPQAWKAAKVVPLFKGGDRESRNNYRPVSLLPLPGKLLEKIVHKRITEFFDANQFLIKEQGGFRKGFSTVSTIADLTDDLFSNINKGETSLAAFIDLRKAFDTVNFDILSNKLEIAGIRSGTLAWCKNYLFNRNQRTLANGYVSDRRQVTCGVPQGSVFGPLLFLVYINDLVLALDNCGVKLYADDTVLYQSGINVQDASIKLQKSLDLFCVWSEANKLSINVNKTKLMVFGSRSKVKKAKNVKVYMKNKLLQKVPTFKYLGIILDSMLTYNHHISSVIRMVLYKMTLLAKMKKYLNNDTALLIYKTMILPYLDYADVIFHKANESGLSKLQRLQNRCLKICANLNRLFSTDQLHKNLSISFLADRRKAHVLNFMYSRVSRPELLNRREIRTRAHDAPLFNVTIPRCEGFKRSIGYFGSTEWNELQPSTRNIDPFLAFKYHNKKEMFKPLDLIVA